MFHAWLKRLSHGLRLDFILRHEQAFRDEGIWSEAMATFGMTFYLFVRETNPAPSDQR